MKLANRDSACPILAGRHCPSACSVVPLQRRFVAWPLAFFDCGVKQLIAAAEQIHGGDGDRRDEGEEYERDEDAEKNPNP